MTIFKQILFTPLIKQLQGIASRGAAYGLVEHFGCLSELSQPYAAVIYAGLKKSVYT